MQTNHPFLKKVSESFKLFIASGTSRSTAKLKPLHGTVAKDIAKLLGNEYEVISQGYGNGREAKIKGRYMDKNVDITVQEKSTENPVCGIAVKFVMQNYSQNSNNYFENMLGETANIRTSDCPYFQIFIILDELPCYKENGEISKWEEFTDHNISKYCKLSFDDVGRFYHTPDKTLMYVVHVVPEAEKSSLKTKKDYFDF